MNTCFTIPVDQTASNSHKQAKECCSADRKIPQTVADDAVPWATSQKKRVIKIGNLKSTITAVLSGLLASSCCIVPLVIIFTGVGGVGLMALARDYQWLTIPLGLFALAYSYYSYFRKRKSCETGSCTIKGKRSNLIALVISTVVVSFAMLGVIFPSMLYALLRLIG